MGQLLSTNVCLGPWGHLWTRRLESASNVSCWAAVPGLVRVYRMLGGFAVSAKDVSIFDAPSNITRKHRAASPQIRSAAWRNPTNQGKICVRLVVALPRKKHGERSAEQDTRETSSGPSSRTDCDMGTPHRKSDVYHRRQLRQTSWAWACCCYRYASPLAHVGRSQRDLRQGFELRPMRAAWRWVCGNSLCFRPGHLRPALGCPLAGYFADSALDP